MSTPATSKLRIGVIGAAHRVHMLIEKPIADTVEAARQFLEAAQRAGVALTGRRIDLA